MKKIFLGVSALLLCATTTFAIQINDFKSEKITEDSAKIIFTTDSNAIGYVNGIKIDEEPKTNHYYYLNKLESDKSYDVKVKAGDAENTITIKTSSSSIDYQKTPDSLKNRVFYEIFVRAFADSDKNGIGDFNGITNNLDYIQYLGANGIWLMPINDSPSYHGYDVTNYYKLNKKYGSEEDFKKLLNEAHKRDIKVIIDLVLNHSAINNKWFIEGKRGETAPYRDWYVWGNEPQNNWYKNTADNKFYYAVFWEGMPDLNYRNQLVVSEAKNIADYWLDFGVDGFRLDAAKEIDVDSKLTHEFWGEFKKSVKNRNSNAILVAENWSPANEVAPYFKEFDMNFDFDLGAQMVNAVARKDIQGLIDMAKQNYIEFAKYNPNFVDAPFLTNHDMKRVMTNFSLIKASKFNKAKQAAALLFSMGGVPFVYYGEEIGQDGNKPDENIREPFDWYKKGTGIQMTKWIQPKYMKPDDEVSVEEQKGVAGSLLEHYKKMIALRMKYNALSGYDIESINLNKDKVFGYVKKNGEEKIAILLNFNRENAEINLDEIFKSKKIYDIYNEKEENEKTVIEADGFKILRFE